MPTQKFVIQYESEKPILPVNTFQFPVNQGYEKENLKMLYELLRFILSRLQFIPLDKSLSHDYNKMQENRYNGERIPEQPRSLSTAD